MKTQKNFVTRSILALGALAFTLSGCSIQRSRTNPGSLCSSDSFLSASNRKAGTIVQGVLINGLTGQRIDVGSLGGDDGIYVLVGGEKYKARAVPSASDGRFSGEFYVCDVPFGNAYQIQAYANGYLSFYSSITPDVTGQDATNNKRSITNANIRLFPAGWDKKDFVVRVANNGAALSDAFVRIDPVADTNANNNPVSKTSASATGFLFPEDTRLISLTGRTGSDGTVTFSANSIVVGGHYKYTVIPPASAPMDIKTVTTTEEFVLGVDTPAKFSPADPYTLTVNLTKTAQALKLLSCSNKESDFDNTGAISLVFNHAVEIMNVDDATATLTNDAGAALVANTAGNGASEQLTISGNGTYVLKFTPNFQADHQPSATAEKTLTVTHNIGTLNLRVADDFLTGTTTITAANAAAACANFVVNVFKQ